MGLPLWQPRVESDIPSRPEAKNPAHARSRIRSSLTRDRATTAIRERPAARNGELRSRERRMGLFQDMHDRLMESNSNSTARIPGPPSRSIDNSTDEAIERGQGEIRALLARPRPRMAVALSSAPRDLTGDSEYVRHFGDFPQDQSWRFTPLRSLERETGSTHVLAQNAERFASVSERAERARVALERTRRLHNLERPMVRSLERTIHEEIAERHGASRPEAGARVDGLGDRDRSLSPEQDSAWDTLLTTVTPDPQPPSAGSSFTSMMSAVTRIGYSDGTNGSSGTSLTGPDTGVEESAPEQQCDSDDEGDPVAFEGGLGDDSNTSARSPYVPGSYADVVRLGESSGGAATRTPRLPRRRPHRYDGTGGEIITANAREPGAYRTSIDRSDPATDDLILQLVGGLGGMQHIVRNLVRREDIPNDWWVDAGLSRTLPRDGSADNESSNITGNNGSSSN